TQADSREILLEIKKAQSMPMAIAFQVWLNINLEVQIHDCSEQPGNQIQDDDGVGETRARHRAKPTEERKRLGPRSRAGRQRLRRKRPKQGSRDQAGKNEKLCRHTVGAGADRRFYENSASVANGSADPGR